MFISAVNAREPNMLSGSFCSGYGDFCFHPSWANHTADVENKPNLSRLSNGTG